MQDSKQDSQRASSEKEKRTFEPRPMKIDMDILRPWLVERNRKVLDMLEEYDRRQEKRQSPKR